MPQYSGEHIMVLKLRRSWVMQQENDSKHQRRSATEWLHGHNMCLSGPVSAQTSWNSSHQMSLFLCFRLDMMFDEGFVVRYWMYRKKTLTLSKALCLTELTVAFWREETDTNLTSACCVLISRYFPDYKTPVCYFSHRAPLCPRTAIKNT